MQSPEKSEKAWRRTWGESKGDHNGGSSVAKEFVTEKTSFQYRGSSGQAAYMDAKGSGVGLVTWTLTGFPVEPGCWRLPRDA